MHSFKAVYKRDPDGIWIVRIPEITGCHSYGRNLAEARRNILEAFECCTDVLSEQEIATAEIADEIQLPSKAQTAVRRVLAQRKRQERDSEQLQHTMKTTVDLLIEDLGIGLRDVGQLLGLSHQRIHQLLDHKNTRPSEASKLR